jgi:hypothetical protein
MCPIKVLVGAGGHLPHGDAGAPGCCPRRVLADGPAIFAIGAGDDRLPGAKGTTRRRAVGPGRLGSSIGKPQAEGSATFIRQRRFRFEGSRRNLLKLDKKNACSASAKATNRRNVTLPLLRLPSQLIL